MGGIEGRKPLNAGIPVQILNIVEPAGTVLRISGNAEESNKLCFCSSLYATRAYFIKAGLDFDHKLAFFENRYCYKNTFNI